MPRIHWFRWICLATGLVVASPQAALALGDAPRHPKAAGQKLDVTALRQELGSAETARVLKALRAIAETGPLAKDLAPAVGDVLVRGASVEVALVAFEACRALAVPALSSPIAVYLRHRTPEVRRQALNALLSTGGPDAIQALRQALHGSDPALRELAAAGLGQLSAREAVGDLFAALDHKVWAAAASLGRLCLANDCDKLLDHLGALPFDTMAGGLEALLLRSATEAPEALKLRVVERVRELATPKSRELLKKVLKQWPTNGNAQVRKALQEALGDEAGK